MEKEKDKEKFSLLNDEFDLELLFDIFKQNLKLIIFLFCVSLIASIVIVRYSVPQFSASSSVKIGEKNEVNRMMQFENIYESNLNGEISRIKSVGLFEKATENLSLEVSYFSSGKFMDTENYKISNFQIKHQVTDNSIFQKPLYVDFVSKNSAVVTYLYHNEQISKIVPVNQWVSLVGLELKLVVSPSSLDELIASTKDYYFIINSKSYVIEDNYSKLNVNITDPTAKIISISFTSTSPQKAADLANAMAAYFLIDNVEKKKESANQMISFTNEQIDKVNTRVNYFERLLQPYKKFDVTKGETSNVQLAYELIEKTSVERKKKSRAINEINSMISMLDNNASNNELYAKILENSDNTMLQSITSSLKGLLLERRNKFFKLKEENYEFKELDYKINFEKKDLVKVFKSLIKEELEELDEIDERLSEYRASIGGTSSEDFSFDKDYLHLSRMFEINKEYYTKLLSKKAEYEMVRAGYISDNEIIDVANPNSAPISPDKPIIYSVCFGISVLISVVLLLIQYLMHNVITAAKDITNITSAPILGMIPIHDGNMTVSQLVVDKNPKSLMSEAFRSIRSNLQFISSDGGSKVIAVTSTVSGEGKTFVALNLSAVIAFSEKKVIIIDLDLRKPKIHLGLNVQNTTGMSSLLINKAPLEEVIQKSSLPNLDFITAGPIPPNPSELILSKRFWTVIDELKKMYDVVVIDNPPIGIVTDSLPILQRADYPIYVLRAGVSKKYFVSNIAVLRNKNKIKNLSLILNSVVKATRYGGYGYGYGYGYGTGYYEGVKVKKKSLMRRIFGK